MALDITITEKAPGHNIVRIAGRLDTDTAPELEKQLAGALGPGVRALRFEMQDLNYISSLGLRVLVKTFNALRKNQAMFAMVNLQPQIKKVLDVAAALPKETVFASVKEADEYFDMIQRKALAKDQK